MIQLRAQGVRLAEKDEVIVGLERDKTAALESCDALKQSSAQRVAELESRLKSERHKLKDQSAVSACVGSVNLNLYLQNLKSKNSTAWTCNGSALMERAQRNNALALTESWQHPECGSFGGG